MKYSSIWSVLILIASALLLISAAKSGALNLSPELATQSNEHVQISQTQTGQQPSSGPTSGAKISIRKEGVTDHRATVILAFTVISGIATALIAWFNYQLVGVTRDLHTATEAALHVDRPFLLVTEVIPDDRTIDRDVVIWTFSVALRNFGVSPADIIDYFVEANEYDPPRSPERKDPTIVYQDSECNRLNDSLIGPNETVNNRIIVGYSCKRTNYKRILTDEKRIAVHGRIRYRGAPDFTYTTYFFWWFFPNDRYLIRANTKALNDHT